MSVVIRLARHGNKGRPFYRIVASHKGSKRDGRFIQMLGTYDPLSNPPKATLKEDLIKKWVSCGAQASNVLRSVIKKHIPGLLEEREKHQREKIIAQRRKRKERARKAARA